MAFEIVSNHFVAHEEDLDDAYELFRARVSASRAEVVAISPRPHPIESDFFLWDLRCEAAYANMPAPETMNLYELNALVDFVVADRDEAMEDFFFEGLADPTRYPSTLGGISELEVRDGIEGELSLITVVYLGTEANEAVAQQLFSALLADVNAVAFHPTISEMESTEQAKWIGPLWVRDATLNIIGKGDGIFSPGKTAWAGWFLTSETLESVESKLTERIDEEAVVLARAVAEPF